MNPQILSRARELLLSLTPLNHDCGLLCGQACCAPDEEGQGGMMLFPGESALYQNVSWAALETAHTPVGDFVCLKCDGRCPREARPLACRIFPLSPYFNASGELGLRMDQRAWAMCPLMEYGLQAISRPFFQNSLTAMRLIDGDSQGHAFLLRWQQAEDLYRIGPL